MLPSSQRLSRQQVTALLAEPTIKVLFNRLGTLKFIENKGFSALTVVTGSKQQKKAVLRNKIRRQIYNIFTSYQKNVEKHSNISGIFYVSKYVYDMSFTELKDTFYALLSKVEKTN